MQWPLNFDQQAADNLGLIYSIERVPCGTPMREILDPVPP
jgi:hypothetical protein